MSSEFSGETCGYAGLKSQINPFCSGYQQTGTLANSEDPEEMVHSVAFHQGLHCLL